MRNKETEPVEASIYNEIISLFEENRKIFLRIIELLEGEKRSIIDIDTDRLWHFTKEKNTCSKEIIEIRKTILEILSDNSVNHDMDTDSFSMTKIMNLLPFEIARKLEPLKTELLVLAEDISLRSEDNKTFINEFLGTLDDMTSIIMGTYNQKVSNNTYSSRCVSSYLQHDGV